MRVAGDLSGYFECASSLFIMRVCITNPEDTSHYWWWYWGNKYKLTLILWLRCTEKPASEQKGVLYLQMSDRANKVGCLFRLRGVDWMNICESNDRFSPLLWYLSWMWFLLIGNLNVYPVAWLQKRITRTTTPNNHKLDLQTLFPV